MPPDRTSSTQPQPAQKGADAYRDASWWYDIRGFFILMGTYQVTLWSHLSFFSRNLGNRHLEAAIGSGTFFALTLLWQKMRRRSMPGETWGIDYAERMLKGARRLFKRNTSVRLIQADLSRIDSTNNYFDSINIAHSFHAFPEPDVVLKELFRVLKPGSWLFVDVLIHPGGGPLRRWLATRVNDFCFRKGILARTCDVEETRAQFVRHGFDIADSYIAGNTYHLLARKPVVDAGSPAQGA